MIQINGKDVSQIRVGNKIITAVYIGTKLVWQSIRSCFGSGFWINSSPWKNDAESERNDRWHGMCHRM